MNKSEGVFLSKNYVKIFEGTQLFLSCLLCTSSETEILSSEAEIFVSLKLEHQIY